MHQVVLVFSSFVLFGSQWLSSHPGSSGIRLSGFAGTSHYERGSVMDSDFWASRILVAWDPSRVPVSWLGQTRGIG